MAQFSWVRWLRLLSQSASKPFRKSRPQLQLEQLETRITPVNNQWTGMGGSPNWNVALNWSAGVPSNLLGNTQLVFPSNLPGISTNNNIAGLQVQSIQLAGSGDTLTGNQITLGNPTTGGGSISATAPNNTISLNVLLGGTAAPAAAQSGINLGAGDNLLLSGQLLGPTGAQLLINSGGNGTGTLTLAAANNALDGPITVYAGKLAITNANALGINSSGNNNTYNNTTVLTGATLQVDNSGATITSHIQEPLLLNGQGSINQGALYYLNGDANNNAVWAGAITLDSNTTLGASQFVGNNPNGTGEGTFTISGVISDNSTGHNLTIGSSTNSGVTTGEIILSGTNTYRGTTTVNDGILAVQNDWGLGHAPIGNAPSNASDTAATATFINSTLNATGTLELDGANAAGGSITVSNQLLVLNNPVLGAIIPDEGPDATALDNVSGNNTWAGNIVLNTRNPSIGVFGNPDVPETNNSSLTVGGTSLITGTIVPAAITGTITGMTGAGVGPIVVTTSTTAALDTGEAVRIVGAGGETAANNFNIPITVLSSTTFSLNGTTGNGTWTSGGTWSLGAVSGASGLTKVGNGQLTLTTDNTYDGSTTVQGGVLEVETAPALDFGQNKDVTGAATPVTVDNGATLELADDFQVANNLVPTNHLTLPNTLNITGNGWQYDAAGDALGALYSHDGINTWSGSITLVGAAAIGVDAAVTQTGAPYNYDISSTGTALDDSLIVTNSTGGISGGALTKVGMGQLILPTADTYTGNTDIKQGWVTIENTQSLGAPVITTGLNNQPLVTVATNAALHLLPLSSTPVSQTDTLTFSGTITGGTFTLGSLVGGKGTAPIPYSANTTTQALSIQDALDTILGQDELLITGMTGAGVGPIVVTTTSTAGLANGATVFLNGVNGNTAANGYWTVGGLTATTFELLGSTGNGTWVTSGAASVAITGLTGGTGGNLIKITTASTAGLANGEQVYLSGIGGATAANGFWTVTNVVVNTSFQLVGTGTTLTGSPAYTAGTGTWTANGTWSTGSQVAYDSGLGAYTVIFNGAATVDTFLPATTADTSLLTGTNPALAVSTLVAGSGGAISLANNLNVTGTGVTLPAYPLVSGQGAVMNLSGINTIDGNVTLNGQVAIGVEQIFDNTTATAADVDNYSMTNNVASQLTLAGAQRDGATAGGITKLGSQRLVIEGPGTYTGPVNINQGVVLVQNNTALGLGGNTTSVAAGTALELGPTVTTENGGLQAGLDVADETLALNGSGDPTFNDTAALDLLPAGLNPVTTSNVFTVLAAGGNPLPTVGSAPTVNNSFNLTAGPFGVPIITTDDLWGGNITIGNNNPLTVNLGVNTRLTLAGVIKDSGHGDGSDLILTGGGELDLAGANTYLGTTVVTEGVLTLRNGLALGGTGNAGEQTLALLDSGYQTLSLVNALAGSTQFSLTFNGYTTSLIMYTGTGATDANNIASALNTLFTQLGGGGSVTVTADPTDTIFSVLFGGSLAGTTQLLAANVVAGDPGSAIVSLGGAVPNQTTYTLTINNNTTSTITYLGVAGLSSTAGTDANAIQTALNNLLGASGSATVTETGTGIFDINISGALFGQALTATVTSAAGTGTAGVVTGGGTLVANGASLELQGSLTIGGEPLVIEGAGSDATPVVPGQWFPVGPSPITNGQTGNNESTTGRINAVAVDPTDPNTIYIGTAGGGAWKTTNGGLTWQPIFDAIPNVQAITNNATSGTYTLTFNGQTTLPLAYNATAAQIQAALTGLTSVGAVGGWATVSQSGNVYTVTFGGTLAGQEIPQMTASVSSLSVATVETAFFSADAIQTITEQGLGALPAGETFTLSFGGQTTGNLAWNAPASGGATATSSVQNALQALSTIGAGNVTVTGNAGGPYTVTFVGALAAMGQATITGTPTGTSPMRSSIATALQQEGGIFQNDIFIGAITVDPVNPQTIYLGTGDTNNSTDSYYGTGVYVSYNSGATWSLLVDDTSGTAFNPFYGRGISQILVGAGGANPTLYVADGDGGSGKNEIQTASFRGFQDDTVSNTNINGAYNPTAGGFYPNENPTQYQFSFTYNGVTASTPVLDWFGAPAGQITNVTGASTAGPIIITTGSTAGLNTGDTVTIEGVPNGTMGQANIDANADGTFTVTVLSATTFSLNNTTGVGTGGNPTVAGGGGHHGGGGSTANWAAATAESVLGSDANNIETALNTLLTTDFPTTGGQVIVTPETPSQGGGGFGGHGGGGGFNDDYSFNIEFTGGLALTNLQNALQLVVPPTPIPAPAPFGYHGPTANLNETVQGGPLTVINGIQGNPGVWRYMPDAAGQEQWTDLTDTVSNNRANTPSPNATDFIYGPSNFAAMAFQPDTPGPDDNYQLSFPQTSATWTSLTMVGGTLFAALGTAAGSNTGKSESAAGAPVVSVDANAVYWTGNPTAAANVTWFVGDPNDPTNGFTPDEQSALEFPNGVIGGVTNGNIKLTSGGGNVYASVSDTTGLLSNVYIGTFDGPTNSWADWAALPAVPSTNGEPYMQTAGGGQKGGLYNNAIFYDSKNGDLYVGGQVAINDAAGVDWTTAGQIWQYSGGAWTDISVDANGNGPATDQHAIAMDSNGNLYFASDGGIWQLNPTTNDWTDFNGNLDISQVNSVAVSPSNPSDILAATQMNGTLLTTNGGTKWTDVNNPLALDSGEVAYDPLNSNIVYATGITSPSAVTTATLYESTQGGAAGSWTPILTEAFAIQTQAGGGSPDTINESIFPFAVDQVNPSRIVVGGVFPGTVLQESLDGGATWSNLGTNLQFGGAGAPLFNGQNMSQVTAIGLAEYQGTFMSDPNFPSSGFTAVTDLGANNYDPATIYVTDGTNIAVTENDGNSWVDRSSNTALDQLGSINALVVDPRNSYTVYAVRSAFSGGQVWETTNAGQTWVNISNNLPNVPAWALVIDPRTGDLYVGTDEGVFSSYNGGTTWAALGYGLPQVQVKSLALNQTDNILTAGTYGRGIFQIALDATAGRTQTVTLSNATAGTTTFTLSFGGLTTATVDYNGPSGDGGNPNDSTLTGEAAVDDDAYAIQTALMGLGNISGTGTVTSTAATTSTPITITTSSSTTGLVTGQTVALTGLASGTITTAVGTATTAITITTSAANGLTTGQTVTLAGISGFAAANGVFVITVTGTTTFTLNGTTGDVGTGTGGTWAGYSTGTIATAVGTGGAAPITITTSVANDLTTGQTVTINGVSGFAAANGTFTITVVNATSFTLNGTAGHTGSGTGGTWSGFAVNGLYTITVTSPTTFTLNGTTGYVGSGTGGTWTTTPGYVTVTPDSTDTVFTINFYGGVAGTTSPVTFTDTDGNGATATVTSSFGGALVATSGTSTWNGPIELTGPTTVGADGTQALPNGISAAQLTINGTISDAPGSGTNNTLTKVGLGNVVLAGTDTYAGQTLVEQGALIVNNPLALSGLNTVVATGAALELESSLLNEPVTLNGDGIPFDGHNSGALRSIANNNTYNGTITLNSNSTIGVDSGSTLTIGGGTGSITNSSGNNYNLVKELAGTLVFGDANSYGGGSGTTFTIPLDTNASNTFAGGTVVAQGSLEIQNNGALGIAGNTTTVLDGAQLQLQDVQQVVTLTNPVDGSTQFNLTFNGVTTATAITYTGVGGTGAGSDAANIRAALDSLSTIGGTAGGSVTVTPNAGDTQFTITFNGNLSGVTLPLIAVSVLPGSGATATVVTGSFIVPATQSLVLSGTGIVNTGALESVAGDNTWQGSVTLAQDAGFSPTTTPASSVVIGVLSTSPTDALDITGVIGQAQGTIATSVGAIGAPIIITTTSSTTGLATGETVTITGAGAAVNGTYVITVTSTTTFTLNGTNPTVAISTSGGTWTLDVGLIVNLAKPSNPGVLTLDPNTGTNLYAGPTAVYAGALRIQQNGALGLLPGGPPTGTTVYAGASLQLDGSQVAGGSLNVSNQTLTLNGAGFGSAGALENSSGNNTWGAGVILASATSIGADAGTTLTVTGQVQDPSPAPVPAASLTKEGGGTVIFPSSNPYSGETYIIAGALNIQNSGALGSPLVNDVQTVTVTGPPTGWFTLAFNNGVTTSQTGQIPVGSSAATVQSDLDNLASIQDGGTGSVQVLFNNINDVYTITFGGSLPNALAGISQLPLITTTSAGTTAVVATTIDGSHGTVVNPTLVQSVTVTATSGTFTLTFNGATSVALSATDPTLAVDMVAALNQLSSVAASGNVTMATNPASGPIEITTGTAAKLLTGEQVTIAGVLGNTAANGTWTITVIDSTHFLLNASAANAAYTSGGTWSLAGSVTVSQGTGTSSNVYTVTFGGGLATAVLPLMSNSPGVSVVSPGAALQIEQPVGSSTPLNIASEPLILVGTGINNGGALENVAGGTNANTWSGSITLGGNAVNASIGTDSGTTLTLNDAIGDGGNGNSLTKLGTGTLIETGTLGNTYTGATNVNAGTLVLDKSTSSAVQSISVYGTSGTFSLMFNTQSTGALAFNVPASGGATPTSSVQNALANLSNIGTGNVTVTQSGNVYTVTFIGTLANTFEPQITVTGANTADAVTGNVTTGGTPLAVDGTLTVGTVVGAAGSVVAKLLNNNQIVNTATVNVLASGLLNLNGQSQTIGTLNIVDGQATTGASGAGVLGLAPVASNPALSMTGGLLTLGTAGGEVVLGGNVTAASDSTGPATITGSGQLNLNGAARTFTVTHGGTAADDLVIAAIISGIPGSGIIKTGAGQLDLEAANTYGGVTQINQGDVQVDGSIGNVTLNGGTLSGVGTVGTINGQSATVNGTVSPGDLHSATPIGTLTSGGGTWGSGTTFAVTLGASSHPNPTAGTDYDQLVTTGALNLGGANLTVTALPTVQIGDSFTIIQTPAGQLSGSFAQGSTIFVGTEKFTIVVTAAAGTVVLTRVLPNTTTTVVSSTPTNTSPYGEDVTFTATVAPEVGASGTVSGSVTFEVNSNPSLAETVPLTNGQATFDPTSIPALSGQPLPIGSYLITATYPNNASFNGSSGSVTQTVGKANTTITVATTPNSPVATQNVTLTATIAATGNTPTVSGGYLPGDVNPGTATATFTVDNVALAPVVVTAGQASVTINNVAEGPHTVQVTWTGDANYNSTSGSKNFSVAQDSVSVTVGASAPTFYGQQATFTATVGAMAPGTGTPTGSVTFFDGANLLGTQPLISGTATLQTTVLNAGPHTITAQYGGDTNFSSGSGTLSGSFNVSQDGTSATLTNSPNPSHNGQSVTFTATVTNMLAGGPAVSGQVGFFVDGSTTAASTVFVNPSGVATYTVSNLSMGSHTVVAEFLGSNNFTASNSNTVPQTVLRTTNVTVTSSINPSASGQSVTFTATVTPMSGTGTPTGTVTFIVDNVQQSPAAIPNGSNQATFVDSSLSIGTHTISAMYNGDSTFDTSTASVPVTQTVSSNPGPTLNSISPTSAPVGSGATTITLTGANFTSNATADFNGAGLTTTFVSATQLMAVIPAAYLTTAGTAPVTVVEPAGTSGSQTFTITNPAPTLTSINPAAVTAGSGATTITLTGSNFVSTSTADFNGTALTTTFVSATQLSAVIPAAYLTTVGTAPVTVVNSGPGGGTSSAQTFTISATSNPAPTLTSISPTSATVGSGATTITLTGSNFVSTATVDFNGIALTTTFVSATQLSAVIPAADLTAAGTAPVTVVNPAPGGGTSTAQTFTITNPAPTLTSISPSAVTPGSGNTTITLTGTGFVSSSTADFNGTALTTTFVSATQLSAVIPAAYLTAAGTAPVTVVNPAPGGGTSASQTFTISSSAATLTSINPTSAPVGSPATTITLTGTNFNGSWTADFDGTALTTSVVSATSLLAVIPAADLITAGTGQITVTNPAVGSTAALTFTITNPAPTLTSINPASATAGSGNTTITLTGSKFVNGSTADFNGTALTTVFGSSTQLTATIPASDLTGGTAAITVVTPSPGGGTSASLTFTIINPAPTLTSLNPVSATAGSGNTTITLAGTSFVSTSTAEFNGTAIATAFVSATQLTAVIPAADLTTAGTELVSVVNPGPGGGTSASLTFSITNPVPTLTSISPPSATVGSGDTTITLTGSNFNSSSMADFNGTALATTLVSATQLSAVIPAADLTATGTDPVTVVNSGPGGGTSASQTFTITPTSAPTLGSTSLTSVPAGSGDTTITLTGSSFVNGSTVDFNATPIATTFVNGTTLTAVIPAADLTTAGTAFVTIVNPDGSTTPALSFVITNPVPTLTSISPTSVKAGSGATTITLTGTSFNSSSLAEFDDNALATTFVSATSLTAVIPANVLATAGTASITVVNPGPGGGTSASQLFTISPATSTTGITVHAGSTVGTFDPATGVWYLKNSNAPGAPDIAPFAFGEPGWIPLVGDWTGDGIDTIGVFDPNTATFYLKNSNSAGAPDFEFQYGAPGWTPVVGDWTGDGKDTIGVVDFFGNWYLRNENSAGAPDAGKFTYGEPTWIPVAGSWNGSGKSGIGMFDPNTGNWYLRNEASAGAPDAGEFQYGGPGWKPVVGDWNADGTTTVGVVSPGGVWYLKNSNSPGAPDVKPFAYGAGTWSPVAGNYKGVANLLAAGGPTVGTPAALTQPQLQLVFGQALDVLASDGVSSSELARLGSVQVQVTHFGDGQLGLTEAAENTILIDDDAAGYGWFVDPTSFGSADFDAAGNALPGSAAAGHMDLLTALLHELGHFTGQTDLNPALFPNQLMSETLSPGVRLAVVDKIFGGS